MSAAESRVIDLHCREHHPTFAYSATYNHKLLDVKTREVLQIRLRETRLVQLPPFCTDDPGELEIYLQAQCALRAFYDYKNLFKHDEQFRLFIGDTKFTVQAELVSYIELKTTKEVIVGQS